MDSLSDRIDKILSYSRLSIPKLATRIGAKTPQSLREILKGNTKNLSYEMSEKILLAFPELNREWLLTGEGEMLNGGIVQEVQGDGNTSVAGNGNNVNTAEVLVKALAEIEEHRKLLSKKDEQIDRLLSVIDKLTNK